MCALALYCNNNSDNFIKDTHKKVHSALDQNRQYIQNIKNSMHMCIFKKKRQKSKQTQMPVAPQSGLKPD